MADLRKIRLRYPTVCSECGTKLAAGTKATWDRAARTAACAACTTKPLERGTAGASSLRRYDRLHDAREVRAKERFGRFSGVYLRLSEEPRTTSAWAVGGRGEERLGRFLETLHDGQTIVVLHDRRIPRSRANIDHIAVTGSGVFVIDAKNYAGKVRRIDKGGWFSSDPRLFVGRRDCTKLVSGMAKQVAAVREALGDATIAEFELEVTPVVASSPRNGHCSPGRSASGTSGSNGRRASVDVLWRRDRCRPSTCRRWRSASPRRYPPTRRPRRAARRAGGGGRCRESGARRASSVSARRGSAPRRRGRASRPRCRAGRRSGGRPPRRTG